VGMERGKRERSYLAEGEPPWASSSFRKEVGDSFLFPLRFSD